MLPTCIYAGDSPFGVLEFLHWDHAWNRYKYHDRASLEKSFKLMKDARVGIVRMDFLWQDIEPVQGEFDFSKYDLIVELAKKHGIEILGILDYSADWASSCREWNCAPSENKLFINYAVAVVSRYKGKVRYWELWNEPDSPIYWKQQDGLKEYCRLLKQVYTAVKEIDPDCKVLNGGLAGGIASVNRLYDNGAGGYFDILNIHIFESPFNQGAQKRIAAYPRIAYNIMKRNNDAEKKIWITEIGSPGLRRPKSAKDWWLGKNPDERRQAAWVSDVYGQLLDLAYVEKVFWAFFRDCKQHFKTGVDHFGLVRWDFSKKPSYYSYKKSALKWHKSHSF
jgi:hypothetical protein